MLNRIFYCKKIFLFGLILIGAAGCITTTDPKNAEEAFEAAQKIYNEGSYDLAVSKLNEFKSRYPYSKYGADASLLIGDAEFAQGKFEEAALTFSQFSTLYPTHKRRPYAMFKMGESYWRLAPVSLDRDQAYNKTALKEWAELIRVFPESDEAKKARVFSKEGLERLANHEDFIASYYCRMKLYHSCAFRSIGIARRYEDFADLRKRSLHRAAQALVILAEQIPPDDAKEEVRESNLYYKDLNAEQLRELAGKLKAEAGELTSET